MQKSILTLCFLFILVGMLEAQSAQDFLDLYEEDAGQNSIAIMGKNTGPCPISIEVDFDELRNLEPNVKIPYKAVIPANSTLKILTLKAKRMEAYSYKIGFLFMLGDFNTSKHDDQYAYLLPFENGQTSKLGQGYDGRFSHQGEYSLDFDMAEGTNVFAARDGIVIQIKEDSNRSCKNPSCQPHGNYILIYHNDGSIASYYHLKKGGSLVEIGEAITAGQLIGKSGNTGYTSGPHLHFEVYQPAFNGHRTLPTKFLLGNGKTAQLKEGESYKSYHPSKL